MSTWSLGGGGNGLVTIFDNGVLRVCELDCEGSERVMVVDES